MQRISRLTRALRLSASTAAIALASGSTMAQTVGGNTLGGMAARTSQDILQLGSYFTAFCYLLGAGLVIHGLYALFAHSRNPNGQHKLSAAALALLMGGAILSVNKVANLASMTMSGSAATATGANSQVLTIQ